MKTDKNWWKHFFDRIYLITDARSILDSSLTRREIILLEKVLNLNKADRILDLCGGHGRHSLELAKRGYKNLTVLDLSRYLINLGKRKAKKENLKIRFICKDARATGLENNSYAAVFIMANSFGYFSEEKENLRILKEAYRVLRNNGKLLLDLIDPEYMKSNLKPFSWHEANKAVVVCRQWKLVGEIIREREMVISKKKGLIRDGFYSERLYNKHKITRLLNRAGFKNISVKNKLALHKEKKDYGFMTLRMIVSARKA